MFVPVTRIGFPRPGSLALDPRSTRATPLGINRGVVCGRDKALRLLWVWSLAVTVCLCVAPAFGSTPGANPESTTGEAWIPNPTSATAQVSTTPGAAVVATPPTQASVPSTGSQALAAAPNEDAAADADPEALTMFRADLDPYGSWVDDPRYGRVWIPNREMVGSGFSPYVTSGHWSLDGDDNWVWVSDYPFGKVVFHYGRWFYSAEYGWAWVPGRTYAPSWVIWRTPTSSTYSYVGWAPMPPRYGWFSTGVVWYSTMPPVSYVFCPSDYLFYPSVGVYVVHDPWLVGRLGIYTSLYYPPYGYYGWGYYGYGYGGMGYYHTRHYGPPVHQTGISPRAIPRERVPARPGVAGTSRGSPVGAAAFRERSGRVAASPSVAGSPRSGAESSRITSSRTAPRSSPEFGARSSPSTSWTAPRSSPLARPGSSPAFTPRSSPSTSWTAPRSSPLARPSSSPAFTQRSSPASSWTAPRAASSGGWTAPRSVSRPASSPSFSPSPRSSPSFHSAPSFRSPSFHSSPSFRGGGRHR